LVDDDEKQATVIVPDDQLALAIGRSGQNARLAARLTGWRIDIKSESDYAQDAVDGGTTSGGEEQEDTQVRCAAVLSNGRRCPNAPIEGSRYCGLEAHQEYERMGGQPLPETPDEEPEVEKVVEAIEADAHGEAPVVEEPPAVDAGDEPSAIAEDLEAEADVETEPADDAVGSADAAADAASDEEESAPEA
jgi:N utilization substance protein A